MKKTLSIILASVFVLMLAIPFAAADNKPKYVCLGDSISAGYGLDNFRAASFFDDGGTYPADAYPFVVSDTLGFNYKSLAMSGAVLYDIEYMLGMVDETEYKATVSYFDADPDDIKSSIQCFDNASHDAIIAKKNANDGTDSISTVKNADIITVAIGSNDICTIPMIKSGVSEAYVLGKDITEEMIADTVEYLYESFNNFADRFPKLLDKIHEYNPDVKLTVIGLYNPFDNFSVLPYGVKIGAALNTVVNSVNELYQKTVKEYNKKHNANAIYIDVTGVSDYFKDISLLDYDSEDTMAVFEYIHPTKDGASYIARQVNSALADYSTKPLTLPKEGTYKIAIGGKGIGTYTLSSVGNLWYIKYSKGYIAFNTVTNKYTVTKFAYGWLFENGAFCSYSASSLSGLFKNKKLTPYYLGISGGALSIVTTPAATTFTK